MSCCTLPIEDALAQWQQKYGRVTDQGGNPDLIMTEMYCGHSELRDSRNEKLLIGVPHSEPCYLCGGRRVR